MIPIENINLLLDQLTRLITNLTKENADLREKVSDLENDILKENELR